MRRQLDLWLLVTTLILHCLPLTAEQPQFQGRIEPRFLDDRHLALVCIYDEFLYKRLQEIHGPDLKKISADATCKDWSKQFHYTFALAKIISEYRPAIGNCLQQYSGYHISGNRVLSGGYWLNATRQSRVPDQLTGKAWPTANADVAHFVFLSMEQPFRNGQDYLLEMPTGNRIELQYHDRETLSFLYKFNQLGFSPAAKRKYAYLGCWQGDAAALDLSRHFGKEFKIISCLTQKNVFSGRIRERDRETVCQPGDLKFTGEQVAELDFSEFQTPGEYFFQIDGVGRSRDFRISPDGIGEAFYLHCRGLFHKRCGISKEQPQTFWTSASCHQQTLRGNFPPDVSHYRKSGEGKARSWGFFDAAGHSIDVNHFELISHNAPEKPEVVQGLFGGWHDAADHDRRPTHFGVVNDLLAAYLMFPENFRDSQLNIPESGDGIPDLLNEVIWGMNMWLRAQQPDGGVGTWIETTGHPQGEAHHPALDRNPYYLSLATRNSSLEYAAYAAMLAIALRQAGQTALAENFLQSSIRAFAFARNPANRIERSYQYPDQRRQNVEIFFRDPPELAKELGLKAGFNLFLLTGDHDFLNEVEDHPGDFLEVITECKWKYSPALLVELLLYGERNPRLYKLADQYYKTILALADEHLQMLEENHSYRVPWYDGTHPWHSHMSWGNCHPLRRARSFILAWKATGKTLYRDAAFLANDWHNGGNPLGLSMTSGLGHTFTVHFLDLFSTVDDIPEAVPGITPFRHTFGIPYEDPRMVHGLFKSMRLDHNYPGCSQTLLPRTLTGGLALNESQTRDKLAAFWPVWHRNVNLESYSVATSEYTVNETIAPAAAVTGCLLEQGWMPSEKLKFRSPTANPELLPGFAPLP